MKRSLVSVKTSVAAIMIAGIMSISLPSYALGAQSERVSMTVSAQKLTTPSGIVKVYQDMREQAQTYCEDAGWNANHNPMFRSIIAERQNKRCAKKLLNDFVKDLDHVNLSAYHKEMTK